MTNKSTPENTPLVDTAWLSEGLGNPSLKIVDASWHLPTTGRSGLNARVILERGCPLDLRPRVFGLGQCAQSHFLQAVMILAQMDQERYLLSVRRSMSEYLWGTLADAIAKQDDAACS